MRKFLCTVMIILATIAPIPSLGSGRDFLHQDPLSGYPPKSWMLGTLFSQPLPWSNDPEFKKTILDNQTMILTAKYQATLKDPLPGEMHNISLAADMIAGTVVPDGTVFSQNKKLGPYTTGRGYQSGPMYKGTKVVQSTGGGVCKIATLLFNLAILSDLPIIERHHHSMTVPYVPPGQDATVYYGVKDIKFLNNTGGPIVIWAQAIGNTLYVAFYSQKIPPKVTWHHTILKEVKHWTLYQKNPSLPKDQERILIPGQDGLIVQSWIKIQHADGKIEIKKLGKRWYDPLPEVIERGY